MRSPLRIVHGWSSLVPRPALSLLEKANLKCPDGKESSESGQRKIRGPRSISGKKLATFRCRTASSGSSPRLSNPARHLPEAAFLLEKPCSILGKQPATLRCHRAPPESSSETSRFTSVVGH